MRGYASSPFLLAVCVLLIASLYAISTNSNSLEKELDSKENSIESDLQEIEDKNLAIETYSSLVFNQALYETGKNSRDKAYLKQKIQEYLPVDANITVESKNFNATYALKIDNHLQHRKNYTIKENPSHCLKCMRKRAERINFSSVFENLSQNIVSEIDQTWSLSNYTLTSDSAVYIQGNISQNTGLSSCAFFIEEILEDSLVKVQRENNSTLLKYSSISCQGDAENLSTKTTWDYEINVSLKARVLNASNITEKDLFLVEYENPLLLLNGSITPFIYSTREHSKTYRIKLLAPSGYLEHVNRYTKEEFAEEKHDPVYVYKYAGDASWLK